MMNTYQAITLMITTVISTLTILTPFAWVARDKLKALKALKRENEKLQRMCGDKAATIKNISGALQRFALYVSEDLEQRSETGMLPPGLCKLEPRDIGYIWAEMQGGDDED